MLKSLDLWLPGYLRRPARQHVEGVTHLFIAVCDHFEPLHKANSEIALRRIADWSREYPRLGAFRDADGHSPRHTFFYPVEQYEPALLEPLAALCCQTGCEVEIHLHHDRDTPENFRATLERGKQDLGRHGLLSRDEAGAVRFGFIHGNWALDDSHPAGHGHGCGVRHELRILREAGCYGDFTLPSAPNRTQTRIVNSLYYATSTPDPKSHDTGRLAQVGVPPSGDLLLVQGPLGLNWTRRKFGLLPRIENADLTAANPPTLNRLKLWLELQIHVQGRPEWLFIKLHTHGAPSPNREMLLGEPMRRFHADLARFIGENGGKYALHYVTAREMVNLLHAAEDGRAGEPALYRDYRYRANF